MTKTKFLEPSLHYKFTDASCTPNNIDVMRALMNMYNLSAHALQLTIMNGPFWLTFDKFE